MTLGIALLSVGIALALLIYIGLVGFDIDALVWLLPPTFFLGTYGFLLALASIPQQHYQVVSVLLK